MVRPIVKDKFLLSQRSAPADRSDLPTAQDMVETIAAHAEECVGMAANMIGVLKRIIVFQDGSKYVVMLNPEVKCSTRGRPNNSSRSESSPHIKGEYNLSDGLAPSDKHIPRYG